MRSAHVHKITESSRDVDCRYCIRGVFPYYVWELSRDDNESNRNTCLPIDIHPKYDPLGTVLRAANLGYSAFAYLFAKCGPTPCTRESITGSR